MTRSTKDIIEDARRTIANLADEGKALWMAGTCPYLTEAQAARKAQDAGAPRASLSVRTCEGKGHPDDCDGAMEQGDLYALPDRPTSKQLRDSLLMARSDASEALGGLLDLSLGQQRQIDALSAKAAGHRHEVGPGHYSGTPE